MQPVSTVLRLIWLLHKKLAVPSRARRYPPHSISLFGGQGSAQEQRLVHLFRGGKLLSRDREELTSQSPAEKTAADCTLGGLFGWILSQNDSRLRRVEFSSALGCR